MASILVTNDDGVRASGVRSLAEALEPLGTVTVVAPDRERSAASHALTLHRPIRVREIDTRIYATDGTPADCVYLGALQVLDQKPDLVVAGINHGANIGDDVTYSGTIAAAIEGTILGIPSFAISLQSGRDLPRGSSGDSFDFAAAGRVAAAVARKIFGDGLPKDILLNVNVPAVEILGIRCTRQGKRTYDEEVHVGTDPRGRAYYWIGSGVAPHVDQDPETDYSAVRDGFVSLCPLHLDLTHYPSLDRLRDEWTELEADLMETIGQAP